MCRFLVYTSPRRPILMANLLTYPAHSIISQSYDARLRGPVPVPSLNGDGFGVGWYIQGDPTPCIFTSIAPAWNNRNLMRLADKITSPLFFAHVRAASPGSPTNESNCHPFQFENLMWMHNGSIAEFNKIKKQLIQFISDDIYSLLQGTTDTEHCFLLFLQILFTIVKESGDEEQTSSPTSINFQCESEILHLNNLTTQKKYHYYPQDILKRAMEETIKQLNIFAEKSNVKSPSVVNFCLTDGQTVIVTRYTNFREAFAASLFFSSGSNFERDTTASRANAFRMSQSDKRQLCHIVSSEPLTDDPNDWIEVPKNNLVIITPHSNLLIYPLDFYAYETMQ